MEYPMEYLKWNTPKNHVLVKYFRNMMNRLDVHTYIYFELASSPIVLVRYSPRCTKTKTPVLVFVVRKRSEDPVKQKTVQKIITSLTHITAATTLSNIMHLSIDCLLYTSDAADE